MTPKQIAREKVLSAAMRILQGRISESIRDPRPYDDAEAEYADDMLNEACWELIKARQKESDAAVIARSRELEAQRTIDLLHQS